MSDTPPQTSGLPYDNNGGNLEEILGDLNTEELEELLQEGGEDGGSGDEGSDDENESSGSEEEAIEVPILPQVAAAAEAGQGIAAQIAQLEDADIATESIRVINQEPDVEEAFDVGLTRMLGDEPGTITNLGIGADLGVGDGSEEESGEEEMGGINPFIGSQFDASATAAAAEVGEAGEAGESAEEIEAEAEEEASEGDAKYLIPEESLSEIGHEGEGGEGGESEEEGESILGDDEGIQFTKWEDFNAATLALAAEEKGQVFVFPTEKVERFLAPTDNRKADYTVISNILADLIDLEYPDLPRKDRSDLTEIYLSLFKESINDEQRPPVLQRKNVMPLVALYHDGRFVQPWLKPITGDLKKVFSENYQLYGDRIFTDYPSGAVGVLQTLDELTKLVTEKSPESLRAASANIAYALRSYFIDTVNPARNKKIDKDLLVPFPILEIVPIGKDGEYTIDVYRYDDEMNTKKQFADYSEPDANNRDLTFARGHELEMPRYYNEFIGGLFEIKGKTDPNERKRLRNNRQYSDKTPLVERVVKSVAKYLNNPAIPGQPADVRGYLRQPLIDTPSPFQIWYMNETKDGKVLKNPQKIWLAKGNKETAPYFEQYYALRAEHYKQSKLWIVPYEELKKNPSRFNITKTWKDTYVIFLLPTSHQIYNYHQALNRLATYYPTIKNLVAEYHIDLSKEMVDRETWNNFLSQYDKGTHAFVPLEPGSKAAQDFDKEWPSLRSFIDYIDFLELIIGTPADVITIHRTQRLPTLVEDEEALDKSNETRPFKSLFSLDSLLDQFNLSLSEIDTKLLQGIEKPNKNQDRLDRMNVQRTLRQVATLLTKPGTVPGIKMPRPTSSLDSNNTLADNKLFTNPYITKCYGKYPYFDAFKDSLEARIYWIMHSPDQGNLYFQTNYYNYLIRLLARIDRRLLPSTWDESQPINYRELIIHIETAGPEIWNSAERITAKNWVDVIPLQALIHNMTPIALRQNRINAIEDTLLAARNAETKESIISKYQGLFYLPKKATSTSTASAASATATSASATATSATATSTATAAPTSTASSASSSSIPAGVAEGSNYDLSKLQIWYEPDKRYYDRTRYLLNIEKDLLKTAIEDYSNLREVYIDFPVLLKEAYENILLAQNKCIGLANDARRPRMIHTLETSIQDHEVEEQDVSDFITKLRQLYLIDDKVKRNAMILELFKKEAYVKEGYLYTKKGEKIWCIHQLDELQLPREEFLAKYDNGEGDCKICGAEIAVDYDPLLFDKRQGTVANAGNGSIQINPVDVDDDRLIGACLYILYPNAGGAANRETINVEYVDNQDPNNPDLNEQLREDVYVRKQQMTELDNWICQMIKNINDSLKTETSEATRGTEKTGEKTKERALATVLDDFTLLQKIINTFQELVIEYQSDNLTDILSITDEELADLFPELASQKAQAEAAATARKAVAVATIEKELRELDPTSAKAKTARADLKKITKSDPTASVNARFKEVLDTNRRTIAFSRFVDRYIILLESILNVVIEEYNGDPKVIGTIIKEITNILLDPARLAQFAINYDFDGKKIINNINDPVQLAKFKLLKSENGETISERFERFLELSSQKYKVHQSIWNESVKRYREMSKLNEVDSNFYYNKKTFAGLIPETVQASINNVETPLTIEGVHNLGKFDLSFITNPATIEELQKFLAQQLAQDSRELYRLIDDELVGHQILLNEKNLAKANTQCYVDMRHFYFEAIMEYLNNNHNIAAISESESVRAKLDLIMTPEFVQKISSIYDRIVLLRLYARQLGQRYKELKNHNQSITPNDDPYRRASKTTYIDMSTGKDNSGDLQFREEGPILTDQQLQMIRSGTTNTVPSTSSEAVIGSEEVKGAAPTRAQLQDWISTKIAKDLAPKQDIAGAKKDKTPPITKESVQALIARIGNVPQKRREEMMLNRNKYFEGETEVFTQIYLNSIQLRKNLNINYSRFYHSLFSNWLSLQEIKDCHNDIREIFNFSDDTLTSLKSILKFFNPEVPNRTIDRTYVYEPKRYGNRRLLTQYGPVVLKNPDNPVTVATSIEEQSDEWIPDATIITKKLADFLELNITDDIKCYQSMELSEALNPENLRDFLIYTLLKDIFDVYVKLQRVKREKDQPTYSQFVYRLILLMVKATDTFFQPEEKSERLRNIWQEKMRQDHRYDVEKDPFTAEMIKLGFISNLGPTSEAGLKDVLREETEENLTGIPEGGGSGSDIYNGDKQRALADQNPDNRPREFLDVQDENEDVDNPEYEGDDGENFDD